VQNPESSPKPRSKRIKFQGRTNIVFAVVFFSTLLVCLYYNLRPKVAVICSVFASFLGAGIWLIMVEDILSPSQRDDSTDE